MEKSQINYNDRNYPSQKQYTASEGASQPSATMLRRIGSTNYRVRVHFSSTSRETVNDKILRLVKNDGVME